MYVRHKLPLEFLQWFPNFFHNTILFLIIYIISSKSTYCVLYESYHAHFIEEKTETLKSYVMYPRLTSRIPTLPKPSSNSWNWDLKPSQQPAELCVLINYFLFVYLSLPFEILLALHRHILHVTHLCPITPI